MSEEFNYPSAAVDIGSVNAAAPLTNAAANTNTVGPDNACKRALIKALTTNTGLVWIDFGAAAVDGACFPLFAGESIAVPLANTNLINALFKIAAEGVALIYTS